MKKKAIRGRKAIVAEISAHGDVLIRLLALRIMGIIVAILVIGSLVVSCIAPQRAKDIWLITGPIITLLSSRICYIFGKGKGRM
jgi:hypothetical protein